MTAHEIHALSGAYAVGALDDVERARFEAHLAVCAECQAEVTSLQDATLLLTGLTEVAPSAALRSQVLADIKKIRPLPPVVALIERRRPRPRRWVNVLAAAAVLGVLGTTAVVLQQNQHGSTQTPPVASPEIDQVLQAADVKHANADVTGGGTATVAWSPTENAAVLITRKLKAAPVGHVYQLWFQKGGTMVRAGFLTRSGDQRTLMTGDPGGATAVGITVEPAAGSKKPTTTPIALMSLETT